MYSTRNIVRVPSNACRASRYAAPAAARSLSYVPVFPRFQSPFNSSGGDFAPLFKLFDDITAPTFRQARSPVVYQPRFDVEEVEGAYNLRGELPGVESKDIHVEFTDPQTLVIKGQTKRSYSSGTPTDEAQTSQQDATVTNAAPTSTEQAPVDNSDAASTHSTGSYVQATVEDDPAEPSTNGQATPAESTTEQPAEQQEAVTAQQPQEQAPSSRYWVSERSVGSFQRTFSFPERIDQDNVAASLKNGILNITVPKAPIPAARRINVE